MFDSTDRFPTQLADITVSGFSASASLGIRCLNNKVINDRNNNVSFTFLFKEKEQSAGFLGWYVNNLEYGTKEFLVDVPMFGIMKTWRCIFTTKLAENVTSVEVRKISMTARILDDLTTVRNVYNSLLSMPLINSLEMTQGSGEATFTRASTATYIENGVLKYAVVDEPRFEKDGILIETSSTNLQLYSSKITSADYRAGNDGVLIEDYKSIDGNLNAALLKSSVDGDTYFYAYRSNTLSVGDIYTTSVFVNIGNMTQGSKVYIQTHSNITNTSKSSYVGVFSDGTEYISDTSGILLNHNIEHIIDDWYRLQLTTTVGDVNGDGSDVTSGFYSIVTVSDGTTLGDGVIFCFPQIEKCRFATSFIPTSDTAVTRRDDTVILPYENNTVDNTAETSYFIEFAVLGNSGEEQALFEKGRYLYNLLRVSNSMRLHLYSDAAEITSDVLNKGQTYKACAIYSNVVGDKVDVSLYLNGELVGTKTGVKYNDINTNNGLTLGARVSGANKYNGHIKNFKIFNRALTDKEVKLL